MRILIDQDNTIADFVGGFNAEWKKQYPHELFVPLEKYTSYKTIHQYPNELHEKVVSIYQARGFFENLLPVAGALRAIQEMIEAGHDVWICTTPPTHYENCVLEKYRWVEKYLGKDFVDRLILTPNKALIIGDVLIDDAPPKTQGIAPSWKYIVRDMPYNKEIQGKRLISWDRWREVLEL